MFKIFGLNSVCRHLPNWGSDGYDLHKVTTRVHLVLGYTHSWRQCGSEDLLYSSSVHNRNETSLPLDGRIHRVLYTTWAGDCSLRDKHGTSTRLTLADCDTNMILNCRAIPFDHHHPTANTDPLHTIQQCYHWSRMLAVFITARVVPIFSIPRYNRILLPLIRKILHGCDGTHLISWWTGVTYITLYTPPDLGILVAISFLQYHWEGYRV